MYHFFLQTGQSDQSFSESFVAKLILLLLTVVLSGFLIPFIISKIQRRNSRNDAILQAQTKLYDEFCLTIMMTQTLLLDISWYGSRLDYNPELHKKAFHKYSEKITDLVASWRAQAIKARVLASPSVGQQLEDFQARMFLEQDTPTNTTYRNMLSRNNQIRQEWLQLHENNKQLLTSAQNLLTELGRLMKITTADLK